MIVLHEEELTLEVENALRKTLLITDKDDVLEHLYDRLKGCIVPIDLTKLRIETINMIGRDLGVGKDLKTIGDAEKVQEFLVSENGIEKWFEKEYGYGI